MVVKAGASGFTTGTSPTFADLTLDDADTPTLTVTDTTNTVTGVLRADDDSVDVGSTTAHAVNLIVSGSSVGTFNTTGLSVGTNGAGLLNATKAATTPNILVDAAETDTGFGGTGADNISVVLGGTRYFSWNTVATNVNAGNFVIVAGTYVQNGGNFTFNDAAGNYDFRVESENNANMFVIDGGDDVMGIGGAVDANSIIKIHRPKAKTMGVGSNNFDIQINMDGAAATTAGSGTNASAATLYIGEPNLTIGTAAITTAATVWIAGAPTEAGSNYALLVDAGESRFDDKVQICEGTPTTAETMLHLFGANQPSLLLEDSTNTCKLRFEAGNTSCTIGTDSAHDLVLYHNTSEYMRFSGTETVINDLSLNSDFRVEGTSSDHLLFVDSSNDSVSIGVNNVTPSVTVNQPFAIYSDDATAQTYMFDNTGTGYHNMVFEQDANGDATLNFQLNVRALDSGSAAVDQMKMQVWSVLDNAGAETSRVRFEVSAAGSLAEVMSITGAVGDVGINVGGIIRVTEAAGPAMLNLAATSTVPTLCPNRADTDTGIGWVGADALALVTAGALQATVSSGGIFLSNAAGPQMINEVADSANPTLVPNRADVDTGIGWLSTDNFTLVAGGVEHVRIGSNMTRGPGAAATWGLNNTTGGVSSTSPSLQPNYNDLDTGIGWVGANEIALITGGALRASIHSGGLNVTGNGAECIRATGGPFVAVNLGDQTVGADTVHFYSHDLSSGNTVPAFNVEGSGGVATETVTADTTLIIRYDGANYKLDALAL
jgi:hypothetical protein